MSTQYSNTMLPQNTQNDGSSVFSTPNLPTWNNSGHSFHESEEPSDSMRYVREPFYRFKIHVLELCRDIWPGACHYSTEIEELRSESSHRIIRMSIVHSPEAEKSKYILRVRKFPDHTQVKLDAANIRFIQEYSEIPVPKLVQFDTTRKNAIGTSYIIQESIPGKDLDPRYLDLTFNGKCQIARELGQIYHQLQQVTSNIPGRVVPGHDNVSSSVTALIQAFDNKAQISEYDSNPSTQSAFEVLSKIFHQSRKTLRELLGKGGDVEWAIDIMDEIIKITAEMNRCGYLDDTHISLCHLDMADGNLLVDSTSTPTISAVLDWDSAIFCPRLLSCAPPIWVWDWEPYNDYEDKPEGAPTRAEGRELKRIFDEAAGPAYAHYAYRPQYRILRAFFNFAYNEGYEDYEDEAEDCIDEWYAEKQRRQ